MTAPLPVHSAKLSTFGPGFVTVGDHAGIPGVVFFLAMFTVVESFIFENVWAGGYKLSTVVTV